MVRMSRRGSIVAALAAFGILVTGGRDAKAGLSSLTVAKGGVVVVGGSGNGSDPAYTYQFDVQYTGTLTAGTYFTVNNLVGVGVANVLSATESPGWVPLVIPTGVLDFIYPVSKVSWTYLGPTLTDPTSSPVDLGLFTITTVSYLPGN